MGKAEIELGNIVEAKRALEMALGLYTDKAPWASPNEAKMTADLALMREDTTLRVALAEVIRLLPAK